MYAKSIIEYVRARAVAGAWSRHLGFVPVAMALAVGVLPFTLEPYFVKAVQAGHSGERHAEPVKAEHLFQGLVLANVTTAPRRTALPLDAQQRAVAGFVSRKYGVSSEAVQDLVRTAFAAGKQFGIDPLLVVAIMAVESSFNPIAESIAGAKGLMQIIPRYHLEKFADFGGEQSVFDPRVNVLVGARIVREYLLMASGNLFTALQTYAFWLAKGAPVGTPLPGSGYPKLKKPAQTADYARGEKIYAQNCALCHGADGLGQRAGDKQVFPPLWGSKSFNWGAGMHQLANAAGFIQANMPLGKGGTLSEQDAWDVAVFMNSHERPQDPRFTKSVAETRKKYHDTDDSLYGMTVNGHVLGSP